MESPLQSSAISNMSVVLSPIPGDAQANQCSKSVPRGKLIHASTPVQSNICTRSSVRNKKADDMYMGNISLEDQLDSTSSAPEISEDTGDDLTVANYSPKLFDVFEDDVYKSPFSEPPRRSYPGKRPLKQLNLEKDEELKEDKQRFTKSNKTLNKRKKPLSRNRAGLRTSKQLDLEEDKENEDLMEKKRTSKKNKTIKKRKEKAMDTTSLDEWAKELSSHFAEVDETDLITE